MVFTIISDNTPSEGISIVPYIGEGGIEWSWNGVDGPDAGRTMDALMHRGLVAIKAKCQLSLLWMDKTVARSIHRAIMPEYVTVITDTVPWESGTVTYRMYSNNVSQKCLTEYTDGTKFYGDLEFPLVER